MALTSPRRTKDQAVIRDIRDDYRKALKKSKDDAIKILRDSIETQLLENDLVATGDLADSLEAEFVEIDAFGFAVNIGTLDEAAVYVEDGRGTGDLPIGELLRWMDVKEIPEEASFPIFRKIRDKGFYGETKEGKHPFEKAYKEAEPKIQKVVEDNIDSNLKK